MPDSRGEQIKEISEIDVLLRETFAVKSLAVLLFEVTQIANRELIKYNAAQMYTRVRARISVENSVACTLQ